jgi:flagellar motility protein MotE (MotC chaperone)
MILELTGADVFGQGNPVKSADQKQQDLIEKEGRLRKEEERLKSIEKEVDAKIQKLNQLLAQVEEGLKKIESLKSDRINHLVKSFEAMPPEEAAVRLVNLGKPLSQQIFYKLNTKKAGAILAQMDPQRVADFSEGLKSDRINHLVKSFEAMPPEEAAVRLVSLGKPLSQQIFSKLNTKKAGAILAQMDPQKVADFSEGITTPKKKIPTQ